MTIFPHADLVLRIDSTPAVAASRLAGQVAARRLRLFGPLEPFTGQVTGARFQLTRTLGPFERSSFTPVIDGEIAPAPGGAEVRIRMRLHRLVAGFMAAWLAGVIYFAGLFTGISLSAAPGVLVAVVSSAFFVAACSALLALGLWMMRASFRTETARATALLRKELGLTEGAGQG